MRKKLDAWLWDHHGDAYGDFLGRWGTLLQRLRDLRCHLIGRNIKYEYNYWHYGEPDIWCDRCQPDGEETELNYDTLPETLKAWWWLLRHKEEDWS